MRDDERIYPCVQCGKMRTKAEGGTVFTVCDACWDRNVDARTVDALAAVTMERDAAVRKCAEIAERLAAVTMERDEAVKWRDEYREKCLAAGDTLNRLARERDEALADVVRTRDERDLWGSRAMKAEAERDELRRFVGAAAQERDEARAAVARGNYDNAIDDSVDAVRAIDVARLLEDGT